MGVVAGGGSDKVKVFYQLVKELLILVCGNENTTRKI